MNSNWIVCLMAFASKRVLDNSHQTHKLKELFIHESRRIGGKTRFLCRFQYAEIFGNLKQNFNLYLNKLQSFFNVLFT